MSDTDLPEEDDVLRRMLNTPSREHKPLGTAIGKKRGRKPSEEKQKG